MGALVGWMGNTRASPRVVSMIRQGGAGLAYRVPPGGAMSGVIVSADGHAACMGGPVHVHRHGVIMLFDGRLDNLTELCRELACPAGSDTGAVLLAGWERHGHALFARLQGPFALAIHDGATQSLTCARDRYGQRPLYYAAHDKIVVFASDVRTVQAWPHLERRINLDALAYVFSLGCAPPEFDLHAGISRLLPGHMLTVGRDLKVHTAPWAMPAPDGAPMGRVQAGPDATLSRLLGQAVTTGSGGVPGLLMGGGDGEADSGYALLRDLGPQAPPLHPVRNNLDQDDDVIVERLRALQRIAGEPLVSLLPGHPALFPQYSEETVLVSSAGGAALLGCAPRYDVFMRDVVRLREEGRPPVWWKTSFYDVMPFVRDLFQHCHGGLTEAERMTVVGPAMTHTLLFAVPDALGPELEAVDTPDLRRAGAAMDLRLSLPGSDLLVLDCVAALDDREAVAPFLDPAVVRHCGTPAAQEGASAPTGRGGVGLPRHYVRDLTERLVGSYMRDLLMGSACRQRGLFSTAQVERHLRHASHRSARSIRILWTMFCAELWYQDTIDTPHAFREDAPVSPAVMVGYA
ncbi:Asparagine synthase, glutamine-hydrolyzing [Komagataeibacter xylinus E25]|nr:Asparagine synthase, glutamine-hydrolyzing [Komagataeibacter xylinus E25]